MKCEHYSCRCARAAELAALADSSGENRYLFDAIQVHSQQVTCREVPAGEPEKVEAQS
jgi:hypothetical protein